MCVMLSSLPTMLELGYFDLTSWIATRKCNILATIQTLGDTWSSMESSGVHVTRTWSIVGYFHHNISSNLPWLSTARTLRVG